MTEAVWLLWNRALIDYVKVATTWLLVRLRRDETDTGSRPASQPGPDDFELPKPG